MSYAELREGVRGKGRPRRQSPDPRGHRVFSWPGAHVRVGGWRCGESVAKDASGEVGRLRSEGAGKLKPGAAEFPRPAPVHDLRF